MNYHFHPEAEAELNDAVDYYEHCQEGLGLEFAKEVESAIQTICRFPHAWAPLSENTRRCLMKRFPYGIVFQSKSDKIIIVAVMHLTRKPGYWTKRRG
jgi:plasmid stabilization system protein ParE